jgi:hypothetical protein
MTDTMTSQIIDLSSWDILYCIYVYLKSALKVELESYLQSFFISGLLHFVLGKPVHRWIQLLENM